MSERGAARPIVGLVLSGGGANACFQVGALRYLYDIESIAPTVIAGTSAGSILAALLAQSDHHAGQRQILTEIERRYETLRQRSDVMVELDWFTELQKLLPALQRMGHGGTSHRQPEDDARHRGLGRSRRGHAGGAGFRLPRWESAPVREVLSALWTVGRSRPHFDALLRGGRHEQSLYRRGPIFERLLAPDIFDVDRLAGSATELRIGVVGLESGELRYVTGAGVLVDRDNRPMPDTAPVGVVDAVHASCAIPGVYRPVMLGAEHYVDGGTRENLAVEIATARLGSTRCYAVNSVPTGLPIESSYADKDMLAIVLRATAGIMFDEVKRAGVARAETEGAVLIAPEIDVLGVLEIDPGLLAITKDYGYLRAAEACEDAKPDERRVTRRMIELRRRIWQTEHDMITAPAATLSSDALPQLAASKSELRDLVGRVPPGRLPADAQSWWQGWEGHLTDLTAAPPWVADFPLDAGPR